jgi:glycosyltransferase involved in cell wall biosynthesis
MRNSGNGVKLPVSAIIPVRNGMKFLPKFLDSNAIQLSKLDQVIVVNDNSSDGTLQFLQKYSSRKANFLILDNPIPGLVSALNLGIRHSRNFWLARFDVDDSYSSFRVEVQFALIEDEVGAIFCDYEIVDANGNSLGIIGSPITPSLTELSLVNSRRTPHPSALLNKRAVQIAGGYIESEHPAEDLGLWLRLTQAGFKIISVPSVLLKYRVHSQSITSSSQAEMNRVRADLVFSHDFSGAFNSTIDSFYKEIDKLRGMSLVSQRIFLSGVDLLSVRRLMRLQGAKNLPHLPIRLAIFFLSPRVIFSGFRYFFDARMRRKNRNS